jgi:type IV pilus assembly protein PilV
MLEVLVGLAVISIGLLGIAKMQALALSSTGTARTRSLAAIEAASFASTMHADRGYWTNLPTNPLQVQVNVGTGAVTSAGDPSLSAALACNSAAAPCTSAQIAARDLADWATAVGGGGVIPPNGSATILCNAATANNPVNCTITLTWADLLAGAANAALIAAGTPQTQNNYVLYVEP